jgi:hypothetical protein
VSCSLLSDGRIEPSLAKSFVFEPSIGSLFSEIAELGLSPEKGNRTRIKSLVMVKAFRP